MSTRVKSILLLTITLVVGILLGIVATSALQHRRMAEIRQVRERGGIMRMLEQAIEFESDAQKQQVEEILEGAESSFRSLRRAYSDSMRTYRESLMNSLNEVLTLQQIEQMEEHLTRRRRSDRSRGHRNGSQRHRQE
ncbi:MAG: hypothetical protein OXM02_11690 [Bacteroidota bacterium]|nr:hypothetical protein [Bacteroidota bacterium]MDE2835163.1 hypothetical protein [Bacteroidota bacterium]